MKIERNKIVDIILFIVILCLLAYQLIVLVRNSIFLYTIQDFSPCPGTFERIKVVVMHPGGLREWMGEWLTQLFYYPVLGAVVTVLIWALTTFLLIRSCRLSGGFKLLAVLPSIVLMTGILQMGYWIFCIKTPSFCLGTTVGFAFTALAMYVCSLVRVRYRSLVIAAWILIGYPAMGWTAMVGVVSMLIMSLGGLQSFMTQSSDSGRLVPMIIHHVRNLVLFLLPPAVVLITVWLYFSSSTETHWRESFLLYGFPYVINSEAETPLLDVAPKVVAVCFVILPLLSYFQRSRYLRMAGYAIAPMLLCAALIYSSMFNYRNVNFFTEMNMAKEMDMGKWDDVIRHFDSRPALPTRAMVMMRDVALAQKNELGQKAFAEERRGVVPQMTINLPIHMINSYTPLMYYWLGMPNYAYMWCMENNMEFGLSPHWLRLMYRCAVVNGEKELQQKYKRLLQSTLFHSDFEVSDAEVKNVRRFISGQNTLINDGGRGEAFLMKYVPLLKYDNTDAQQLALHYSLLSRQPQAFGTALERYKSLAGIKTNDKLPVHYQEALLLYEANKRRNSHPAPEGGALNLSTLDSLGVSDAVRQRFADYTNEIGRAVQQVGSTDGIGSLLFDSYGDTYWWYHDFNVMDKTY